MNYDFLTLADERDRQRELADIRARAPAEAPRTRPNRLAARQPNVRPTPHYLGPMNEDDCTLCGARTWKAERGKGGRRPCCDAGKTEIPAPECDLNDLTPIRALSNSISYSTIEQFLNSPIQFIDYMKLINSIHNLQIEAICDQFAG